MTFIFTESLYFVFPHNTHTTGLNVSPDDDCGASYDGDPCSFSVYALDGDYFVHDVLCPDLACGPRLLFLHGIQSHVSHNPGNPVQDHWLLRCHVLFHIHGYCANPFRPCPTSKRERDEGIESLLSWRIGGKRIFKKKNFF